MNFKIIRAIWKFSVCIVIMSTREPYALSLELLSVLGTNKGHGLVFTLTFQNAFHQKLLIYTWVSQK